MVLIVGEYVVVRPFISAKKKYVTITNVRPYMEGIQTRSDIMTVLASEIQERVFSEKVIKSTYIRLLVFVAVCGLPKIWGHCPCDLGLCLFNF